MSKEEVKTEDSTLQEQITIKNEDQKERNIELKMIQDDILLERRISEAQELKKQTFWQKLKGLKENAKKNEEEIDPHAPQVSGTFLFNRAMIRLIGPEWFTILAAMAGAIFTGVSPLLFYFLMGELLNALAPKPGQDPADLISEVTYMTYWMLGIAAFNGLSFFIQITMNEMASERIGNRLKKLFFNKMVEQEMAFFDRKKSGSLLSNMSDDMQIVQTAYGMKLPQMVQFVTQVIGGLGFAFSSSWSMTLVLLASGPVIMIFVSIVGGFTKVAAQKASEANEIAVSTATEVISSMRTVRSMAGEMKENRRFSKNLSNLSFISIFKALSNGLTIGVMNMCIFGIATLAFWYGGKLVREGTINVGDMFRVFGMMIFCVMGLGMALAVIPEFSKASAATAVILKTIERTPTINYSGGKKLEEGINGNIEMIDVTFRYPTRQKVKVLDRFSMSVKSGETIALVGHSGCGKSTIMSLIMRFYDPEEGKILIEGHDIKELDTCWLHQNIGIVTQEPVLFADTIRNNILYGVADPSKVTEEDIIEAAKAANAHNFICDLPNGYDTMAGERGVSLSGGQKQRIAIARAILQNPKLLLLDEATSALDAESEKLVQDALNKLMIGRTCIVIAHRLATIKNATRILVMENGRVKEIGKHEELLKIENGLYRSLATRQLEITVQNSETKKEDEEQIKEVEVCNDIINEQPKTEESNETITEQQKTEPKKEEQKVEEGTELINKQPTIEEVPNVEVQSTDETKKEETIETNENPDNKI